MKLKLWAFVGLVCLAAIIGVRANAETSELVPFRYQIGLWVDLGEPTPIHRVQLPAFDLGGVESVDWEEGHSGLYEDARMVCRSTGARVRCLVNFWADDKPVRLPQWRGEPLLFVYSRLEGERAVVHQPVRNGKSYEFSLSRAGV